MKLIDNWKAIWWKRWSTWLAALFGLVVTAVLSNSNLVLAINDWVSGDTRGVKAAVAGIVLAVIPIIVTQIKQAGLASNEPPNDPPSALPVDPPSVKDIPAPATPPAQSEKLVMTSVGTSILAGLAIVIDPIVEEAKTLETKAIDFLKEIPADVLSAAQKAVAFIKNTSLGTAIANVVSLVNSSTVTGPAKFEAVVSAAAGAYSAFVGAGGLSGLIAIGVSVLRQLVQSIYDDFAAAFGTAAQSATTTATA